MPKLHNILDSQRAARLLITAPEVGVPKERALAEVFGDTITLRLGRVFADNVFSFPASHGRLGPSPCPARISIESPPKNSKEIQVKLTTMLLTMTLSALCLAGFTCFAQGTSSGQDQMGAPSDGTTYTVVTSSQVTKADAVRCGMNDASVPNMAIFRAELRQYTEYKDGKVVRTWRDTVEVFDHCHEP